VASIIGILLIRVKGFSWNSRFPEITFGQKEASRQSRDGTDHPVKKFLLRIPLLCGIFGTGGVALWQMNVGGRTDKQRLPPAPMLGRDKPVEIAECHVVVCRAKKQGCSSLLLPSVFALEILRFTMKKIVNHCVLACYILFGNPHIEQTSTKNNTNNANNRNNTNKWMAPPVRQFLDEASHW
jgi:hypothetical protein